MDERISRSEQKRRAKQLEELVAELSTLPSVQIDSLPCPEEIRDLLREAGAMKEGGARNRFIRYITKRLRNEPVDELYTYLSARKGRALEEKKEFREVEYLRDALITEAIEQQRRAEEMDGDLEEDWPSRVVEKIAEDSPGIDQVQLTRLARLFARTRNRRHSREIFRIIKAAREQQVLRDGTGGPLEE
ncbi:MAG: hypothetical protein Kow0089_00970 [Desulfobulbaceae bacterium]